MAKRKLTALQKRQQKEQQKQVSNPSRASIKRQQRATAKNNVRRDARAQQRQIQKYHEDLHRKISRANARLLRLERSGIVNSAFVITTNALGRNRFTLPRNASEGARRRLEIMVDRFLNDETSTIKGAMKDIEERRSLFNETISAYVRPIAPDVIEKMYYGFGDIDMKSLVTEYLYEEIMAVFSELEDMGIKPTTSNIGVGIESGIDTVVSDELKARGVKPENTDFDFLIDIAKDYGFEAALRQYEFEGNELEL